MTAIYDDCSYCTTCDRHEPSCWCTPADPTSISYDEDKELCECGPGDPTGEQP